MVKDNSLFAGAKFGDKFMQSKGQVVVYKYRTFYEGSSVHILATEHDADYMVDDEGRHVINGTVSDGWDIVGSVSDTPAKRWRAKMDEEYYTVIICTAGPFVDHETERLSRYNNEQWNAGNYYRTEESAQAVADQIAELLKQSKA